MFEPGAVARRKADNVAILLGDANRAAREHDFAHPFVGFGVGVPRLQVRQRGPPRVEEKRGDGVDLLRELAGIGPADSQLGAGHRNRSPETLRLRADTGPLVLVGTELRRRASVSSTGFRCSAV